MPKIALGLPSWAPSMLTTAINFTPNNFSPRSKACAVAGAREALLASSRAERPEPPKPCHRRRLADLVDAVRVEGDVILNLRHCFKWGLVSPHRIERAIPANRNAVVGSETPMRAIRRLLATLKCGNFDISRGDILNGRIGGLAKRQRTAGVRDNLFRPL